MPIIKKITTDIETVKNLKIEKKIFDEVNQYCKHFGFTFEEYLNQALQLVLDKDKEWKIEKFKRNGKAS